MQLALTTLALSLAASPWTGLWRIEAISGSSEAYHLIVRPGLDVEFYSQDWYQFDVLEPKISEDSFEAVISRTIDTRNQLVLTREGETLHGALKTAAGGGVIMLEQPLQAKRIWAWAPPQGHEWLAQARHRDSSRVDVLSFLVENAPTEGFEPFLSFWNDEIEPRFYPFIQRPLYGASNDLARRRQILESLFNNLDAYRQTDLETLKRQAVEASAVPGVAQQASCTVFVPLLDQEITEIYSMASVKNAYPDDAKLCCGARRYQHENFRIIPVPLPKAPEKATKKKRR